ncbi:MAG TPA: serine--tRNA ligase [Cryomorphaceae bacterium]|nr:serine--tRNA ligase [Owenweeksia sp.]HCQ15829.1 serine--tRNA ligase [Cryomorphaceae bacterium]|tara:strand:+ start:2650 stop:3921 length:1272 start_codon:yes stop_codon:yes gene_type:complete
MLELSYLREHKDEAIKRLSKRKLQAQTAVEDILRLDEQRRSNQAELDAVLAESNSLSKEIGQLFKEGKAQEANTLKDKTASLKEKSKELQQEQEQIRHALENLLVTLPNTPHELVKEGADAHDNEEIKVVGQKPGLAEGAKPHWELADQYGLIDFELGVKITGAGFPVYKGKGARLQRALINFFLEQNIEAGYEEYQPPHFVNEASGFGTGQLPDKEGQMYHMEKDNLYAIPTAEVPITNLFRDVIIDHEDLPIRCTAYTPCFRREAGSYGKDVRGLNRLHQFDKVEVVTVSKPEASYGILEEMVAHVGGLLEKLGLHYRILRLCGGDMGFTSAMTYDFEVWSAAQERWLEVSSVSNFETYQSNRLKLRYRGEDRKTQLCHTLNGSALALPRVLAALLENNQSAEGIRIPDVLIPYTGFEIIA